MPTLTVSLKDKSYNIYIQRGIIDQIGKMIKQILNAEKIAVITDKNVEHHYWKQLRNILIAEGFKVCLISVEPGEKSKSIDTLINVYRQLINYNITRSDLILTLGGGVAGDLGGFAAATFLRGVPFIQIPTSLIAQVDSSVGGKVAVDMPEGKNLIGNFYHPKAVFIDPDFLNTLDDRFFNDGMAEVIKYASIRDKGLFERLMEFDKPKVLENIEDIIDKCLRIKSSIVQKDEKDLGLRMVLNFGHTLGHAIERYFGYEKYTHGEAVSIGMHWITKKSEEMGLTETGTQQRLKQILEKYGLPYKMPLVDKIEIIKSITVDKKTRGKKLHVVILKSIGESFIKEISTEDVQKYFL